MIYRVVDISENLIKLWNTLCIFTQDVPLDHKKTQQEASTMFIYYI